MSHQSAVALNGRFTGTLAPTGTHAAVFALFDAILRAPERTEPLVIFADSAFRGVDAWAGLPGATLVPIPFSAWTRAKAQRWEQFTLPGLCRKHGCALAHHPITTSPCFARGVKSVVTLHDLNFRNHPEWSSRAFRAVYTFTAIPGLFNAERVVATSDYVRTQAEHDLGLDPQKLRRVYHGVRFCSDGDVPFARTNISYILSVGALQPHKNLPRLIEAFRLLRKEFPDLELWVAGHPQQRFTEIPGIRELLETPGVEVLSDLTEPELHAAYRNARVFCFPSLEEGSGVPILEAMACGVPVVVSNSACMPEIAGGHAELVDPFSVEDIAAGLRSVLEMPPEALEKRIKAACARAAEFTWKSAAREYLAIYRELLATAP